MIAAPKIKMPKFPSFYIPPNIQERIDRMIELAREERERRSFEFPEPSKISPLEQWEARNK